MIIGSTAMKHHFPECREPSDMDVFIPLKFALDNEDAYWDDRLLEYRGVLWWISNDYATINELYTIKVSHAYWELPNNSWGKHMYDTIWLKDHGAVLIQPLHDILYSMWEHRYGAKKMKFMEKDGFFDDAVDRVYDHDSIHDSVAFGDQAMYIQTLKEEGHTAVDMDYIKRMDHEDIVRLYREEVAATALERIVIPRNYHGSPGAAYLWALRRTITSLTKGWSAQFLVDNYCDFMVPDDYVSRHLARKERLIKL